MEFGGSNSRLCSISSSKIELHRDGPSHQVSTAADVAVSGGAVLERPNKGHPITGIGKADSAETIGRRDLSAHKVLIQVLSQIVLYGKLVAALRPGYKLSNGRPTFRFVTFTDLVECGSMHWKRG
jgi:hypothetical protein